MEIILITVGLGILFLAIYLIPGYFISKFLKAKGIKRREEFTNEKIRKEKEKEKEKEKQKAEDKRIKEEQEQKLILDEERKEKKIAEEKIRKEKEKEKSIALKKDKRDHDWIYYYNLAISQERSNGGE